MNRPLLIFAFFAVLIGILWLIISPGSRGNEHATKGDAIGLADAMASMQYYTHKLILAAEAENLELVDFYLHELEEISETVIDEVPEYDGHSIGPLVEAMLVPEIEALESQVDAGRTLDTSGLIRACNDCHLATDHAFIVIEHIPGAMYLQRF